MKERIIRFGTTGIFFILGIIFTIWCSGGNLTFLSGKTYDLKLIELAFAVIASPSIGFILSSLIIGFLKRVSPNNSEFLKPDSSYEQDYLAKIYNNASQHLSGVEYNVLTLRYSIANFKTLFISHQILLRKNENKEIIDFTSRRMDFYWTHLNTVFSIILGGIIGIFIHPPVRSSIDPIKLFSLILVLFYLLAGLWLAFKNLKESNDFEKRFIIIN